MRTLDRVTQGVNRASDLRAQSKATLREILQIEISWFLFFLTSTFLTTGTHMFGISDQCARRHLSLQEETSRRKRERENVILAAVAAVHIHWAAND